MPSVLVPLLVVSSTICGWIPLFDGHSLSGWTTPTGRSPRAGWFVEGTAIHLDPQLGRPGPLVTESCYGDFELVFEWRLSAGGNSGIKYRVRDYDGRVLGLEYQMIDDRGIGSLRPEQRTAALYDLYPPSGPRTLRPPGEFNRGRIVVCGNRIEHWLNGRLVVCAIVGSPQWRERIANSKFAQIDGFGENHVGRIMLTDHNSKVTFRNLFIRSL